MSLENWSQQRRRSARASAQRGLEGRLRSLETKVLYVADRLDRDGEPVAVALPEPEPPAHPDGRAAFVRRDIRARRMREQFFAAEFCTGPAWDMLLDLYLARLENRQVSVSSLSIAAEVPATTAVRWIKLMTEANLFRREDDPDDGRRIFVALTDAAFAAIGRYFDRRSV
jgi:DNA-binding MarR family transcriptional regulator